MEIPLATQNSTQALKPVVCRQTIWWRKKKMELLIRQKEKEAIANAFSEPSNPSLELELDCSTMQEKLAIPESNNTIQTAIDTWPRMKMKQARHLKLKILTPGMYLHFITILFKEILLKVLNFKANLKIIF